MRGRRRGIRVTSLAEVVVDGGGVGEEDDDSFPAAPPGRTEYRGGRARIWGPPTAAVDAAKATARTSAARRRGAACQRETLATVSEVRNGRK